MSVVLKIIGITESTYYYHHQSKKPKALNDENGRKTGGRPIPGYSLNKYGKPISDEQIKEWLLELIAGEESIYGYRKLTKCLFYQYKLTINKKKVYRLCKQLGILKKQRQLLAKYPRRLARNRTITGVNQLWEMDIKYGYIAGENRFFYLMGIIDVYDRVIIDYHIGLTCEDAHAAHILERALWKRKLINAKSHPVIRTDNGPQFISHVFEKACERLVVDHERIPPKTPNLNAHIESFHSILEKNCYAINEFSSYTEVYQVVTEFIEFYDNRYLHGSLNDMPPAEFHKKVIQDSFKPFEVTV